MKKKQVKAIAVIGLILAILSLVLGVFLLLSRPEDQSWKLDQLELENQELREQVAKLQDQLENFMTLSSLKDWALTARPWADSTGADVTLTAIPTEYQPGMGATLLVMLGDRQAASVPCVWDGSVFTGTANLNAADGYSYYCLLSGPTGVQQLTLMSPISGKVDVPVYLQSALSSYCNLVINDWVEQSGSSLVLTGAYAQVQLPRIQTQELTITAQNLVLRLNGKVTEQIPVKLYPSEVAGSYEATLSDIHMPMPALEQGDTLELYLEITLSDGRNLKAFGIGWYLENGKLSSSVG